jgi:hypothetical protein
LRNDWKFCLVMLLHASRFARHLRIDLNTLTENTPTDPVLLQPVGMLLATCDSGRGKRFYAGLEVKGYALNARQDEAVL